MRDSNNLRISIRLVAHQDLAHPIGLGNGIAIERTAPTGDRAPALQVLDDALADYRKRRGVVRAEDGDRENHRSDGK